jgi:hypothetical protein
MLPGAITIGLALAVVVPLALISNLFFFFFDHPVRIGPTLGYMFASVVGVTLFLAAGGTMLRVARSLAWQIAAGMVLLAGPLITVYLVARLLDTSMGELLMRREAVVTTVLILVGYGASAWLRFARSG